MLSRLTHKSAVTAILIFSAGCADDAASPAERADSIDTVDGSPAEGRGLTGDGAPHDAIARRDSSAGGPSAVRDSAPLPLRDAATDARAMTDAGTFDASVEAGRAPDAEAMDASSDLGAIVDAASTDVSTGPVFGQYDERATDFGLGRTLRYGRGAAFVDFDSDGFDDLFVADTDSRFRTSGIGISRAYRNAGDGTFTPYDLGVALSDIHANWVAAFADYDNDGDPDLLLGNGGYTMRSTVSLYENRLSTEQRFVDVTASSGLAAITAGAFYWWGATWADYDGDGWLDAAVTRRHEAPLLLHNEGDGTFTNTSAAMGIDQTYQQDTKSPVFYDYDGDGDQDLYIAGIYWHALYENVAGAGFIDVTPAVDPAPGADPFVFAAVAADFDQDGREDLYQGRWHEQDTVVFREANDTFTPLGAGAGLDALLGEDDSGAPYENTMGLGVGDLYDDGLPDIVIGTGVPWTDGRDIVYCNEGSRRFARCTDRFVEKDDSHRVTRGHAPVFADIDRDGRTELFFNLGGHPEWDQAEGQDSREVAKLFVQHDTPAPHTATLTLQGTVSNRDAFGAKVTVTAATSHYYFLHSVQGFQAQSSKALVVDLGEANTADVRVDWPSGAVTDRTVAVGVRLNIVEPAGP